MSEPREKLPAEAEAILTKLVQSHTRPVLCAKCKSEVGGQPPSDGMPPQKALQHVMDEIEGQLRVGVLKDRPLHERIYWAQVASVARDALGAAERGVSAVPPKQAELPDVPDWDEEFNKGKPVVDSEGKEHPF